MNKRKVARCLFESKSVEPDQHNQYDQSHKKRKVENVRHKYVYVYTDGRMSMVDGRPVHLVKIGKTIDPVARRRRFNATQMTIEPGSMIHLWVTDDHTRLETSLHRTFADLRYHPRREWFAVDPQDVVAAVKKYRGGEVWETNFDNLRVDPGNIGSSPYKYLVSASSRSLVGIAEPIMLDQLIASRSTINPTQDLKNPTGPYDEYGLKGIVNDIRGGRLAVVKVL